MKACKRCGQKVQDTESMCTRCGGIDFVSVAAPQQPQQARPQMQNNNNGQPGMRPQMQGQPARPQMQGQPVRPNMQGQPVRPNMQGPNMQGQPVRPQMQGQQNMGMQNGPARPNMQGQPGQMGMNNYGQQNMGMQNMGMQNGPARPQQPQNEFNQTNAGVDSFGNPVEFDPNAVPEQGKKKGKKDKKEKKNKKNADNNMMGAPENEFNGFNPNENVNEQPAIGNFQPVTVKQWLLLWVQLCIPVWNIILIIKTLKDKHENPSIQSYIKAYLIMLVISLVLGIVSSVLMSGAILAMLG